MAAARFWKLASITPFVGSILELSALKVYEGATDVTSSAALTSTAPPGTGSLSNLVDSDLSSSASWGDDALFLPGFCLVWDFGGTPRDLSKIEMAGPSKDRFPYKFGLYSSSDGEAWSFVAGPSPAVKFPGVGSLLSFVVASADPYADKVSLLVSLGEKVGATVIKDESPNSNVLNLWGNAAVGFAGGVKGLLCDGSGDYLEVDSNSGLSFGTGDFTVEVWVRLNALGDVALYDARPLSMNGAFPGFHMQASTLSLYVNSATILSVTSGVTVGTLHHLEWSRVGGVSYLFRDGELLGSVADTTSYINPGPSHHRPIIGALGYVTHIANLNGVLAGVRVTTGVGRHSTTFTPPAPPSGLYDTAPVGGVSAAPGLGIGNEVVGITQSTHAPFYLSKDIYDSGRGRVIGTVKEKGTPNAPLKREVFLFDQITWRQIRATWSDPVTGEYVFNEVDMNRKYAVVAEDYAHMYRAVIADNLSPELMPQFV